MVVVPETAAEVVSIELLLVSSTERLLVEETVLFPMVEEFEN